MYRIAVVWIVGLLLLMTVAVARAGEPEPNAIQRVVISINRVATNVVSEYKDNDLSKAIDKAVPMDDFKIVVEPWDGYVGIKFTF